MGHLYFGDNLEVLRDSIQNASVDLIYLDPPFNSKRDYNVLFKTPKGHTADASITAFEDSWHWGAQAEREFDEILHQPNTNVAEMMQALRRFLGENDMMAYLVMMCNRLLELHRVLKSTGSLYLHCDPTASHYLKVVLDGVFGKENYRNEIVWERSGAKAHASTRFASGHDCIFYYAKSGHSFWRTQFLAHRKEYIESHYNRIEEGSGRRYRLDNLMNPNHDRPNLTYEFPPGSGLVRVWRWTKDRMMKAYAEGRVYIPEKGVPSYKRYLDEMQGTPLTTVWTDISPINSQAQERLGYPTQKPLTLLERIIKASCPDGGVFLDPFCGCGTAVHAAEKQGLRWVGIDITHLAISVIEERLRKHFPGIQFETHGTPRDIDGAKDLARRDKYEFQWWVCHILGAQPYQNKKKGADGGIDGIIYFKDVGSQHKKVIVSVKGGDSLNVSMIRDLGHVVSREKAELGLFVTLSQPTRPMREEAAKAGFYAPPFVGAKFPKIQILTIEGLLNGMEQPLYPSLTRGGIQPKKARGQAAKQLPLLLPYEGKRKDETVDVGVAPSAQTHKRRNAKFQEAVG